MAGTKTPLFARKQPGGVFIFTDETATTGDIFFVDSGSATKSDSAGAGQNPDIPFATVDFAIGQTAADNGDRIYVMPGHAETVAAAITLDVAGVSIFGIGEGRSRPAITGLTGVDTVDITAANCLVQNIRLIGVTGVNANVNVAAADAKLVDCVLESGAGPLLSLTVASGDRGLVQDCLFLGTADGPDVGIDIQGSASDDWVVSNCLFNFGQAGIDLGVIRADADTAEGWLIEDCTFIGVDTVAIDFNSSAGAVGDGIVQRCNMAASAALTSIEDIIDVGGYAFIECYATDAVTAGARVPITTAS